MSHLSSNGSDLTARYAFVQFSFWMNFASIVGFASIYLLSTGFSNTQIGIMIAAAGILSALLQPMIASYADRPASPSLKKIALFIAGVTLIFAILLNLSRCSQIFTGLFYGGCIALLQVLTPMINSLGMESLNQGRKLNFGISRGMGSLAYAVAAYLLGILVDKKGPAAVPPVILLGFGLLTLFILFFPFQKSLQKAASTSGKSTASSGVLAFFMKYKRFTIVLIGCILLYISHIFINNFTFQIVETKGGTSADMGVAMALGSVLELPTMFLFGYMQKKARCDIWFRISGIFFTLKILFSLLVTNMAAFYVIQIFQMGGWALITVSSVYYVNSIMEPEDAIKGQAYITMTYTLGSVLGAMLGGTLLDHAGVNAMLITGTIAALVGAVLFLFASERPRQQR